MRGWSLVVVAGLVAVGLAGCGSKSATIGGEVIAHSTVPVTVNGTRAPDPSAARPSVENGHLAGVVVDKALHPLPGAIVTIPGLDLKDTARRDASFSFVDLPASSYYIKANMTGFYDAETIVEVSPGTITRVKFILDPIPPPSPYHITESWNGFAEVTDPGGEGLLGGSFFCNSCTFAMTLDRPAQNMVLEAAFDSEGTGETFYYRVTNPDANDYAHNYGLVAEGKLTAPLIVNIAQNALQNASRLTMEVIPGSFPTPEIERSFQVFATAFYNERPPAGFSVVAGHT